MSSFQKNKGKATRVNLLLRQRPQGELLLPPVRLWKNHGGRKPDIPNLKLNKAFPFLVNRKLALMLEERVEKVVPNISLSDADPWPKFENFSAPLAIIHND
ncbi:hypothetical protein Tco_0047061 [Tanacetum coccineum]